jgi:tellurite resistance protein
MGILSSLWNSVSGPEEVEEAFIDAICAAILFDAEIASDELSFAVEFVAAMMEIDPEPAAEFVDASFERIQGRDVDLIIEEIVERLDDDEEAREGAVVAAATVVAVDGHVSDDETSYVYALAEALGFDEERIQQLFAQAQELLQDSQEDI